MTAEAQNLRVDEDGFVCVVAPDTYEGFVDADWTLDSLLAHFVEQMNRESLFVAYPGPDRANGRIAFETVTPQAGAGRSASGTVQVGASGLWLTDYTQLTMAAQFPTESPMARSSERLTVAPGAYLVTLQEEVDRDGAPFTLSASPTLPDAVVQQSSVPWFN